MKIIMKIIKKTRFNFFMLTLTSFVLMSIWGCKDEETTPAPPADATINVAQQNMGLYSKITATWCGPCGSWG